MAKTITVTAYTYEELSDKAKERAREWYQGVCRDDDYTDDIDEDMRQQLELAGVSGAKPLYSLGYTQGSGACFEIDSVDVAAFIRQQKTLAEMIERKTWAEWSTFNTAKGDIAPLDLKPGDKVYTQYRYSDVDENGVAIKNEHGGYSSYHACWREGDPEPPGSMSVGYSSPFRVEAVETEGKIVRIRRDMGTATEKTVEDWKSLQFSPSALATLEEMHNDDLNVQVTIKHDAYSRYYHANTMTVAVTAEADGRQIDQLFEQVKALEEDDPQIEALNKQIKDRQDTIDTWLNELETAFKEWSYSVGTHLEKVGYDVIEGNNSDESLEENIKANGYMFTAEGRRKVTLPSEEE